MSAPSRGDRPDDPRRVTVRRPPPPGADASFVAVHLVAVQAEMRAADYRSAAAFRARIDALAAHALGDLPPAPTLLAFPEALGLPLPLTLSDAALAAALAAGRGRARAALRWALRHAGALLRAAPRAGAGALWHPGAVAADALLRDTFAGIARRHGVTVVAGAGPLPFVDREPSRGAYVRRARVRNVALLFGPAGELLARSEKVVPTGLERRAGVRAAPLTALGAAPTPLGRIGVAICLDAFHRSVIERLDAEGCALLVQPSANHAPWERRWPADGAYGEGEAWLRFGARAAVRGRRSIRYAVNPMLVGDVGPLRPRGRSSVAANPRFDPTADDGGAEGWPGVVALAPDAERGAALRVGVWLPGVAGAPATPPD